MKSSAVVVLAATLAIVAGGCGRLGYDAEALGSAEDAGVDGSRTGPKPDGGPGTGATEVCGDGEVTGSEACDDGNSVGGDGCSADCARRELCGDGAVTTGERCDDGNSVNGDGCDNDCRPSCEADSDCVDGNACNGDETCNAGACMPGSALPDATPCGEGMCRGGTCAPAGCGNRAVDADEECDDGNTTNGDGCDNDCTFSCVGDPDCDDAEICNGQERCDVELHTCTPGGAPVPGTICDRDANPATRDICVASTCVASRCGDTFVDDGEHCDDGNTTSGDGCDNDCTFSCVESAECDDGLLCNGAERCDGNRCAAGTPAEDGTMCPGGTCMSGACFTLGLDGGTTGGGMCGSTMCTGRQVCCCDGTSWSCVPQSTVCLDIICPDPS